MTYAYLKKYSPSTDKRGFYIDGPSWTLQTSSRADRFFRQSSNYCDGSRLPLTVVKTLIHFGEAETGDRTSKEEILRWFPGLKPEYCDMNKSQLDELQELITDCLEANELNENESEEFRHFLQQQTPIDPPVEQ